MRAMPNAPIVSSTPLWAGRIVSTLPVLLLLFSATMKFVGGPKGEEGFLHLGWPPAYALGLGILEVACVAVYLFPSTAALGAILLTGYFGGAMATHIRIGELPRAAIPALGGVLIWFGLFLRDPRLRALIPIRR